MNLCFDYIFKTLISIRKNIYIQNSHSISENKQFSKCSFNSFLLQECKHFVFGQLTVTNKHSLS